MFPEDPVRRPQTIHQSPFTPNQVPITEVSPSLREAYAALQKKVMALEQEIQDSSYVLQNKSLGLLGSKLGVEDRQDECLEDSIRQLRNDRDMLRAALQRRENKKERTGCTKDSNPPTQQNYPATVAALQAQVRALQSRNLERAHHNEHNVLPLLEYVTSLRDIVDDMNRSSEHSLSHEQILGPTTFEESGRPANPPQHQKVNGTDSGVRCRYQNQGGTQSIIRELVEEQSILIQQRNLLLQHPTSDFLRHPQIITKALESLQEAITETDQKIEFLGSLNCPQRLREI